MNKVTWSAEQICDELQKQVNEIREIAEDKASVIVPLPQENELDATGCNWGINSIRNGSGYMDEIQKIIQSLQFRVNLQTK